MLGVALIYCQCQGWPSLKTRLINHSYHEIRYIQFNYFLCQYVPYYGKPITECIWRKEISIDVFVFSISPICGRKQSNEWQRHNAIHRRFSPKTLGTNKCDIGQYSIDVTVFVFHHQTITTSVTVFVFHHQPITTSLLLLNKPFITITRFSQTFSVGSDKYKCSCIISLDLFASQ